MNIKRISIVTIMIFFGLLATACGSLEISIESSNEIADQQNQNTELVITEPPIDVVQPTTANEEPLATSTTMRYTFEQLGISLDIPEDLYVRKDLDVNYEDQGKLDSYLFYIQNYGYPGGPSSGDFQMYGHLQYNLPPISWDEFSNNQINSPMNAYADYIEVGGLRGYDTQVAGQRNRFVYRFYLEGSVLTIAVADPTSENKTLSDQIIQSLELIPGGFSDTSHEKLVSHQLFQILIPDDWKFTFQPTIGMQLSSLEITSPDLEVIEEVGGPHSNIYYKKGIFLHGQVIEDDTAVLINWPNQRQYGVYFNGIEGTVYVYVEPSTAEGEIRTVIAYYEGKSYLLRFGYADDADRDTIDRIISSFNITPETFYQP
ncbi:MAG: hypothetical protein JRE24_11795 [Deltaproteobacteria bacterium]|nr:hypothetical protein [Deltaproteobacteria bacterium]